MTRYPLPAIPILCLPCQELLAMMNAMRGQGLPFGRPFAEMTECPAVCRLPCTLHAASQCSVNASSQKGSHLESPPDDSAQPSPDMPSQSRSPALSSRKCAAISCSVPQATQRQLSPPNIDARCQTHAVKRKPVMWKRVSQLRKQDSKRWIVEEETNAPCLTLAPDHGVSISVPVRPVPAGRNRRAAHGRIGHAIACG